MPFSNKLKTYSRKQIDAIKVIMFWRVSETDNFILNVTN